MLRIHLALTLLLSAACGNWTPAHGQCHHQQRPQQRPCVRDKGTIVVSLPSDARLFINGQPTTSTGGQRSFETPPLEIGEEYTYQVKMQVQRAGELSTHTKSVTVRARQVTRVQFVEPVAAAPQKPTPYVIATKPPQPQLERLGDLRHPSLVQAVAITLDSRKAFVALNDGTVQAYSLETRKPLDAMFRTFAIIYDLALDPQGERVAIAGEDGMVTVLEAATLKVLTSRRFEKLPLRLVYTPDGGALMVALIDGRLLKLNGADLTTSKEVPSADGGSIEALACSRDGTVATSHLSKRNPGETTIQPGKIKLWSADALEPLREWTGHPQYARSLAFDPSGDFLVSGGGEGVLKVWKLSDLSLVKESKDRHQQAIASIAFAPKGPMVTGGYDGLCQFWDGKSFEPSKGYPNYRGYFMACAISADGRWLVRGGTALDFVPMHQPENFERVAEYGGAIMGLAVASDRKRLATGGLDRRVILWEVGKGITSKTAILDDWVTAVEFCDDGKALAAGLVDGTVQIYSAGTMQPIRSWVAHDGRITALATVDGKLVSLGDDGMVRIWDLQGKRLRSHDEKSPCRSLSVLGTRFAVGTADGSMTIHDLANESSVKSLKGRPLSVTALAFTRSGQRLVAGYFDGSLESFDTQTWVPTDFQAGTGESVLAIDANPSSEVIAVGFRDGAARIYKAGNLQEAVSAWPGLGREIFAVRWAFQDIFAVAGASNSLSLLRLKTEVQGLSLKTR